MIPILILFSFLSFSFAEDCGPEVDLNKAEPLKDMAVLDQDGAGLCYGFAGAQLVEYEMRQKGTKIQVSPVDLSMKAGEGFFSDRDVLDGGLVADIMDAAKDKGVVSKECMEAAIAKAVKNNSMTSAQYVHFLELVYAKHKWSFFEEEEYYNLKGALLDEVIAGDAGNRKNHLKDCNYQDAMHGLQEMKLLGAGVTGIIKKLVSECKIRDVYTYEYQNIDRSDDNEAELVKKLDGQLSNNKPAALSICASSLHKGNTTNYYKDDNENCGRHALLAVGKRSNGGKCEYLLRNSWGAQWQPAGVTCACRTSDNTYYPDCNTLVKAVVDAIDTPSHPALEAKYRTRTNVGCWFPADNIIPNTYRVGGVK